MLKLVILTNQGRQVIDTYQKSTYSSQFGTVSDIWEFQTTMNANDSYAAGDVCELYYGQNLIMVGYVTNALPDSTGNILINGKSKTDILRRSFISSTVSTSYTPNRRIVDIIRTLCESVDVELVYEANISSLTAVDYTVLEQDKSILENIKSIIEPYNLLMTTTKEGKLFLFDGISDKIDLELKDMDVIKSSIHFDDTYRGQEYNTISQKPARVLLDNPDAQIENTASLTGTSPLPITKRKWLEASNINVTDSNSISANISEGSTIAAFVETNKNFVALPGNIVKTTFDYGKFTTPQKWLVESLIINDSTNGLSTIYNFVDPQKYVKEFDVSKIIRSEFIRY